MELLRFAPCAGSKWLARMRVIEPVSGTPCGEPFMSSFVPAAALVTLTVSKNGEMSPAASARLWASSRHCVEAASLAGKNGSLSAPMAGSAWRKATL